MPIPVERGFLTASFHSQMASSFLSAVDPDGPADAVLLLRRTGTVVGGWTRHPAAEEILNVMAATMIASIDTIIQALGEPSPRSISVETDENRLLATHVDPQLALVLVASRAVGQQAMRHEAARILDRITKGGTAGTSVLAEVKRALTK